MADPKDNKDKQNVDLDTELGLDKKKNEPKSDHSLDDIDPIFSKKPVEHSEKPIQVEIGSAHV